MVWSAIPVCMARADNAVNFALRQDSPAKIASPKVIYTNDAVWMSRMRRDTNAGCKHLMRAGQNADWLDFRP